MGRFNLYNILAAAAAAEALGIPGRSIRDGIAALIHVPGRLEKVSTAGQPAVFVDYAHTDDALRRVLQNLSAFRDGKTHHRLRVRRGPGPGKTAAHGRGRIGL